MIQRLRLEGLFFKKSLCHEGSSYIHFPMAHIKASEVLIIYETSRNHVYVTGEKVEFFFFMVGMTQYGLINIQGVTSRSATLTAHCVNNISSYSIQ